MFTIASWYQLNGVRTTSALNDPYSTNSKPRVSPFMGFTSSVTNDNIVNDRRFQRRLSMISKTSLMVMIIEGTDPNWGDFTTNQTNALGELVYFYRIGVGTGRKRKMA